MGSFGRIATCLALTIGAGCTFEEVPHTEVVVVLQVHRMGVGDHLVRVRVWRGRFGTLARDCATEVRFPGDATTESLRVPVIPDDNDNPGQFTIAAEVLVGDEPLPVAWQRAFIDYVPDARREVQLHLSSRCGTDVCSDDESCVDGRCVGACFAADAMGELVRGACEPASAPVCNRFPTRLLFNDRADPARGGEEFCRGATDSICFCLDPASCLPPGSPAGCCRTPIFCGTTPACSWRVPTAEGRCGMAGDALCPSQDRCVPASTIDSCCGAGVGQCFGT